MSDYRFPTLSADDALAEIASGAVALDVRKPEARAASGRVLDGALWRDPFAFDHTDPLMRETRRVVAFCVHGHEVSHFAAALLRLHGVEARLVAGGFEALADAGPHLVAELRP